MADDRRIDGAMLERMALVARGFPGHVVSVRKRDEDDDASERAADEPEMSIDGLVPADLAASCLGGDWR